MIKDTTKKDIRDHDNDSLRGKRALALISGGIDSPVAVHLMTKRGMAVDCIHFDNEHLCSPRSKEKVKALVRILSSSGQEKIAQKMVLFVARHAHSQEQFKKKCDISYQCILCKRMMARVAAAYALQRGYQYLITGDNLGQVASQTLSNMSLIDSVTSMTILRPLLCFDKVEIIRIAQEIGSYHISTIPGDCCSYVPKRPKTKATPKAIERQESLVDIDNLARESLDSIRQQDIRP